MNVSGIKNIDVALEDIHVGKRFREDLGNIDALAASIKKDGLIHPIAITKNTTDSPEPFMLIAGGRRFTALSHLKEKDGIDTISCRLYERDMTEMELRVLEYAENLYRKDMTWQEECKLKSRIHTLQQKIHGPKVSTKPDAPGWSLTDMAQMTGASKAKLSEDIGFAKMMEDMPEVPWESFKTQNDARKMVKAAKKQVAVKHEAAKVNATLGTGDDKKKTLIDSYHVKNFLDGIKNIGNSTIDIVEIDPPYAIDLQNVKKDYSYSGYNEIDAKKYPDLMQKVFRECYRVMKPNSWLICWFGPEPWFEHIYAWLISAGFATKRMCGIWNKNQGQTNNPERVLANAYEMFFYARKGSPMLAKPGSTNVFNYPGIPAQHKVHPTERPIEMIQDVLETFSGAGANLLVPFAGSGNTLIAGAHAGMLPIGFDLTEEYKESYIIKVHKMIR